MSLKAYIPSKTFLFGEYGVLWNAPCVVFSHSYHFEVTYSRSEKLKLEGFNSENYLDLDRAQKYKLEFKDPYNKGGWGRSSAEFLSLLLLNNNFEKLELRKAWESYQKLFSDAKQAPSGADIISQISGGFSCFQKEPFSYSVKKWPFEKLSFLVYQTPYKTNTFKDISLLNQIDKDKICLICEKLNNAFSKACEEEFCKLINEFWACLKKEGLTDSKVDKAVEKWQKDKRIKAVKGCGAKGSDNIMIFFNSKDKKAIKEEVLKISPYCFEETDVSKALCVEGAL